MRRSILITGLLLAALVVPVWGALVLRWQDNSLVEEGYWVLRQRQPNEKNFVIVKVLPANSVTWTDNSTQRNRTYCYMVVAYKGNERSYSNVGCAKEANQIVLEWAPGSESRFSLRARAGVAG